jgi:hypothetical protein
MNYKLNYLKDEMLVLIIYKKIDFAYDKISPIRNIYYNCSNKL